MVVKEFSPHSKNLVQFRFTEYKDSQWSELLTIVSIQNPCSGVNHTVHDKNKEDLQSSYYTPLEYKKHHQIILKHKNCVALKSQIRIIQFPCNVSKNFVTVLEILQSTLPYTVRTNVISNLSIY